MNIFAFVGVLIK